MAKVAMVPAEELKYETTLEAVQRGRRSEVRALQERGYVRCEVYTGNLARMHDFPVEQGPKDSQVPGSNCDWVPAWLEWHLQRFKETHLSHVTQRERLEQAKALMVDKESQLVLLTEAQLAGGTLNDPDGDLATVYAINLLKKELYGEEGSTG